MLGEFLKNTVLAISTDYAQTLLFGSLLGRSFETVA